MIKFFIEKSAVGEKLPAIVKVTGSTILGFNSRHEIAATKTGQKDGSGADIYELAVWGIDFWGRRTLTKSIAPFVAKDLVTLTVTASGQAFLIDCAVMGGTFSGDQKVTVDIGQVPRKWKIEEVRKPAVGVRVVA